MTKAVNPLWNHWKKYQALHLTATEIKILFCNAHYFGGIYVHTKWALIKVLNVTDSDWKLIIFYCNDNRLWMTRTDICIEKFNFNTFISPSIQKIWWCQGISNPPPPLSPLKNNNNKKTNVTNKTPTRTTTATTKAPDPLLHDNNHYHMLFQIPVTCPSLKPTLSISWEAHQRSHGATG